MNRAERDAARDAAEDAWQDAVALVGLMQTRLDRSMELFRAALESRNEALKVQQRCREELDRHRR